VELSPRKRQQLTAFLAGLPEAAALKLFAALEDEHAAGGELPRDVLMAGLRERLLERGAPFPARRLDAKRVFFTPFEDFFVGAHGPKKRAARIARACLEPIWRLLGTASACKDAALAAAHLDDALAGIGDVDDAERALFIAAEAGLGRLCDEARADAGARAKIIDALGGENAFEDLRELRAILKGADHFKRLQAMFPSPSAEMTEEKLFELRHLFFSAHELSRTLGGYLLLALKGRLERPWRALGVYYNLKSSADERVQKAAGAVSILAESLFDDLEALARDLERAGAGAFEPRIAAASASYFVDFADGLARQAERVGDNVYLNRAEASRDVGREAFDRFAEQAFAALREATPVRAGGGSSRLKARRPDYAKPISAAVFDDAIAATAFLAEAEALAARLGADAGLLADIVEDARDHLKSFAKDMIVEIRAAEGDGRRAARGMFERLLDVAAPLLDREDIALLRDRAAAAAVAV